MCNAEERGRQAAGILCVATKTLSGMGERSRRENEI